MAFVFTAVLLGWIASLIIRHAEEKKHKKWYAEVQAQQVAAEQKRAEDFEKIKQLAKAQSRERQERIRSQVEIQREQMRIAKEQEAQRKELEQQKILISKQDEKIRGFEFKLNQAEKNIDFIQYQMEKKREYGEYLERERDACTYGSRFYHNWNNKVIANNNQLHTLETQLDKAIFARDEARIKIDSEVA